MFLLFNNKLYNMSVIYKIERKVESNSNTDNRYDIELYTTNGALETEKFKRLDNMQKRFISICESVGADFFSGY